MKDTKLVKSGIFHSLGTVLALALAGCSTVQTTVRTTTDDFAAMHAYERADKVCRGSSAYRERQSGLQFTMKTYNENTALAKKGYKLVETCQEVMVPSGITNCIDQDASIWPSTEIVCTENKVKETQCNQTPVAIDVARAVARADEAYDVWLRFKAVDSKTTGECIAKAMKLSPKSAHDLYQSDRDVLSEARMKRIFLETI